MRASSTRDVTPTLQALPRLVSFEDLDRDMRALFNTLDGAQTEIKTRLDYILEALAAMEWFNELPVQLPGYNSALCSQYSIWIGVCSWPAVRKFCIGNSGQPAPSVQLAP